MKEQRQPGPGMRGGTSTVLNEGRRRFCKQMGGLGALGCRRYKKFQLPGMGMKLSGRGLGWHTGNPGSTPSVKIKIRITITMIIFRYIHG